MADMVNALQNNDVTMRSTPDIKNTSHALVPI
jgi:hypothetical protein